MRSRGAVAGLFALLFVSATASLGAAQTRDESVAAIRSHLEQRGATRVAEVERTFLFEGESRVREERFDEAGCVGWLAIGFGDVRDVDLALSTRAGQQLVDDTGAAPFAYARLCAARGTQLYVSASLYAGRGELLLLRVDGAPRELGRLPLGLPLAVSAGGRLEGSRSVGTAVDDAAFEGFITREERTLAELGYVAQGAMVPLELRAGMASTTLTLTGERCVRVVALVPFARGVGVLVAGADGRERGARELMRDRATAYVCPSRTGAYEVRVESRALRAIALLRVFEHPEARPRVYRGHTDAEVLAIAEAEHVARARGLELAKVGEGWLDASAPLVWSVNLRGGECTLFAVTGEQGFGAVDARLADPRGVVVARNEGQRAGPSVFHCASRDGLHQLALRSRGSHAKVTVWLGRDRRDGP